MQQMLLKTMQIQGIQGNGQLSQTQIQLRKQNQKLQGQNQQLRQKIQRQRQYQINQEKRREQTFQAVMKKLMDIFPQNHKFIYEVVEIIKEEFIMKMFEQSKFQMSGLSSSLRNHDQSSISSSTKDQIQVSQQIASLEEKKVFESYLKSSNNDSLQSEKQQEMIQQQSRSSLKSQFGGISSIKQQSQIQRQLKQKLIKAQYQIKLLKLQNKRKEQKQLSGIRQYFKKLLDYRLNHISQQQGCDLNFKGDSKEQTQNIFKSIREIKDLSFLNIQRIILDGCVIILDYIKILAQSNLPFLKQISLMNAGLKKLNHFQKFKQIKVLNLGNSSQLNQKNSNQFTLSQIQQFLQHSYINLVTLKLSVKSPIQKPKVQMIRSFYLKLLQQRKQKQFPKLKQLTFTYIQLQKKFKIEKESYLFKNVIISWQSSKEKSWIKSKAKKFFTS